MRRRCHILLLALAVDALVGEVPNAIHPVVMLGRWLMWGERLAPERPAPRFAWGTVWLFGGVTVSTWVAKRVPRHVFAQGAVASTLLAYRALDQAVGEVQAALARNDLVEARRVLSWHLVSRPTAELSAPDVAAAAIESLAENLSDSVIAPMSWFLVGGLPALAAYRMSNTADAMWGYRTSRYEYLGKTAARCDDVLNFVPARITTALLIVAAQMIKDRGSEAWTNARQDHRQTASPNAGWPMATLAGALDTTLVKHGQYRLGDGQREPDVAMLAEARMIALTTVLLVVGALLIGASIDM